LLLLLLLHSMKLMELQELMNLLLLQNLRTTLLLRGRHSAKVLFFFLFFSYTPVS
jgi:hypothetical protein